MHASEVHLEQVCVKTIMLRLNAYNSMMHKKKCREKREEKLSYANNVSSKHQVMSSLLWEKGTEFFIRSTFSFEYDDVNRISKVIVIADRVDI